MKPLWTAGRLLGRTSVPVPLLACGRGWPWPSRCFILANHSPKLSQFPSRDRLRLGSKFVLRRHKTFRHGCTPRRRVFSSWERSQYEGASVIQSHVSAYAGFCKAQSAVVSPIYPPKPYQHRDHEGDPLCAYLETCSFRTIIPQPPPPPPPPPPKEMLRTLDQQQ